MRFAIETWAPDYGAPVGAAVLEESAAPVDVTIERRAAAWSPIVPRHGVAPGAVAFVDGVQRIDARVWVTGDDGVTRQGVCASWAAGVVRCDGRAQVVVTEVRRGLLCPGAGVERVVTRHGEYRPYPVVEGGGDPVHEALGRARGDLEGRVATEARAHGPAAPPTAPPSAGERIVPAGPVSVDAEVEEWPAGSEELLVVDGPLGDRRHIAGAVGYVKAHHVAYLPAAQQAVIGQLAAGQRTPLFTVGQRRFRYSWYLRLPGPATHPWWGIVRCEASGDLAAGDAAALADRVAATLPRFASQPHNDPRAPQNLHPIAGLERELRRCLGDPVLLERALRLAASQAA